MTIKSNDVVFRAMCIVAIAVSTFYYAVNNGFFGFLILVFGLLFLFGGAKSIELTNREVIFKFERLVQLWTRQKIIRLDKIKEVEYIPGKVSGAAIFLNLLEYVPGNVKPKDEIVIEFLDGEIYRHQVVGTKKEFKEFFERLKEKINATR